MSCLYSFSPLAINGPGKDTIFSLRAMWLSTHLPIRHYSQVVCLLVQAVNCLISHNGWSTLPLFRLSTELRKRPQWTLAWKKLLRKPCRHPCPWLWWSTSKCFRKREGCTPHERARHHRTRELMAKLLSSTAAIWMTSADVQVTYRLSPRCDERCIVARSTHQLCISSSLEALQEAWWSCEKQTHSGKPANAW